MPPRVADIIDHLRAPLRDEVEAGRDERFRLLDHRQTGRGLDQVLVGPVAVDHQYPLETMAHQRQGNVRAIAAEGIPADRDRTRKVHVVRRITVHYGRQAPFCLHTPAAPRHTASTSVTSVSMGR